MGKFGAMPHAGVGWQTNQTAACIEFVMEAEEHLLTCEDERVKARLKHAITKIKEGRMTFHNTRTVEAFLAEKW